MTTIFCEPLTAQNYQPFGSVVAARTDVTPTKANLNTADRYNFLADLQNLRGDQAKANLCVFRCRPMIPKDIARFDIKLLERHPSSSQLFVPMQSGTRFLVVVALGASAPDLSTLRAFWGQSGHGITYQPGIWHHPLIVVGEPADFVCIVWENGRPDDCETLPLSPHVQIQLDK